MLKVLFIVKSFLTHDRQNALCVERVSTQLKSMGVSVDYLSWELNKPETKECNVYTVIESEEIEGFGKYQRVLTKIIRTPIGNTTLVKKLYSKIIRLYKRNKYDAVISVINPSEGAEALYLAKKNIPEINAILYEIDPNSNRFKTCKNLKEKIWRFRSIKWEKKIYSSFDYIIHMASHRDHYSNACFSDFRKKTIYLDIPNFEPFPICNYEEIKDYRRLIYAGAFYPSVREPFFMFSLLKILNRKYSVTLDIYTGNSMRNYLIKESNENNFIYLHNEVSENELMNYIKESDVLLSVGNNDSDFLPSKTLMYMSTYKPIIHFYSDADDVSLKYFSFYPNILMIDQRKEINDEMINQVIEFLKNKNSISNKSFERLSEDLYKNSPQYSAKRLVELIK